MPYDFTEKDVHCIAQHMAAYLESVHEGTVASYAAPCERCDHAVKCLGEYGVFNPDPTFHKLFKSAKVPIPRRARQRGK